MEGHAGQDLDVRPAEQAQPDDGVEGIELDLSGCERGQVPAAGGAGRRIRRRPSSAPWRSRMRPIVRTDGTSGEPRSMSSRWMALAPYSPRMPSASSARTTRASASISGAVRLGWWGAVERSAQSTASSGPSATRANARWTVPRPMPRRAATCRWVPPARTNSTIARRRSSRSRRARLFAPW